MNRWLVIPILITALGTPGDTSAQHTHEHDASHAASDVDRDRWSWQLPNRVIEAIGVAPGMVVADVGAGQGYFVGRLAEMVGERGRVYANDVDPNALAALRRAYGSRSNVTIVHGRANDPRLPDATIDLALLVNVIHLVDDPPLFLDRLSLSLTEEGRVVFVQWDAAKMGREMPGWDPVDREKYTMRTTLRTIYDAGYEVIEILNFLPVQNIYICAPRRGG
jgi:ubiquinone/menaquinone biosynthesis C-methylase UbiE